MELYIAKDGQRLGPYSMAEVRNLVLAGTITNSDLAWQQGQSDWIPLNQIPGFAFVAPAVPAAPVPRTTPEALNRPLVENKSFLKKMGSGTAALAYLAFKFKFLLPLLKTGGSMFIMIWGYSLMFGWRFAAGFVLLLFVHEMGHVAVAKLFGLPVSLPMFIPFLGAYTALQESPRDAWTQAWISCGGPIAGGIGSWICYLVSVHLQAPWLMAVASTSFVVNIINMIPVPPLDGGGICAAISPWFWFLGLLLLGVALLYFHSFYTSIFIIVIVFFMTIPRLQQTFSEPQTEEMQLYYATHLSNRLIMAVMYLGMLAFLVLGYGQASGHIVSALDNI